MIERQIAVPTSAGRMSTFMCHPERLGPHPIVIFFMDAPGIREELRDMARRLATVGYYVLLPNLYYRSNVEELGPFIGEAGAAVRDKIWPLMESLTIDKVMDDTDALLAFVGTDDAASKGRGHCVGYCMSGQYAISAAARHPDRIASAASIYGTRLMTDQADSAARRRRQRRSRALPGCRAWFRVPPAPGVRQGRRRTPLGTAVRPVCHRSDTMKRGALLALMPARSTACRRHIENGSLPSR